MLTKDEKHKLVQELRKLKAAHELYLREVSDRVAQSCRRKVFRRVKRVGMTMRSAQIRSVLDLERKRTPTAKDVVNLAKMENQDQTT